MGSGRAGASPGVVRHGCFKASGSQSDEGTVFGSINFRSVAPPTAQGALFGRLALFKPTPTPARQGFCLKLADGFIDCPLLGGGRGSVRSGLAVKEGLVFAAVPTPLR